MCRYGAETATTKTTTVHIYRVLNHLVGGYIPLATIAWVGQASVGQVETTIYLLGCKPLVRWIYHHKPIAHTLDECR